MQTTEMMEIALKAGEIMLTSGAEIYRVEETITRVCSSYQVQCESFVLPTGIFISVRDGEGCMNTSFKRIRQRTVDLNRIEKVNTFSRSLVHSQLSYEMAKTQLEEIMAAGHHSMLVSSIAAAVGSFVFAVLFRGSYYDGLAAAVVGFLLYLMRDRLSKKGFFQFFELFSSGLAAGFLSIVAVRLFPVLNEYKIIIGAVMLYLPGVAITNGIKDAFYGDLVASFTRMGEAFLTAVAVAVGVAISVTIGINWW